MPEKTTPVAVVVFAMVPLEHEKDAGSAAERAVRDALRAQSFDSGYQCMGTLIASGGGPAGPTQVHLYAVTDMTSATVQGAVRVKPDEAALQRLVKMGEGAPDN